MRPPERRKYPRYGFQSEVELITGSTVLRAFVTDISMGGMFVMISTPFPPSATFTGRLLFDPPLFLHCIVRRVIPGRGMGVSFESLSDEVRARLEKLLATILAG